MRLLDDTILYSASDLVDFLGCRHLSALKLARLEGTLGPPPARPAGTAELASQKGMEHELEVLEGYRGRHGEELVEVESEAGIEGLQAAAARTRAAMEAGAPLIYQAAFLQPLWSGYADFLERVDEPSDLGRWSYVPVDSKLARQIKPYFVFQLCTYAELIDEVQGRAAAALDLILGDREPSFASVRRVRVYYRRLKGGFLAAMAPPTVRAIRSPSTIVRCAIGHSPVRSVATPTTISVSSRASVAAQTIKLEGEGLTTVAALAGAYGARPSLGDVRVSFERLRAQASLQDDERLSGDLSHVLLDPGVSEEGPPIGFGLMPRPSEGDLFFDIEGDPFYDEGLEYLWGVSYLEDGELAFRAFWGLDQREEKRALEEFVDFVYARRRDLPDLHVYHYAPYERTALGRLMGRYATREEEIDDLFRERVLVDLYRVVAQSMRISRPSYSLKEVEHFYDQGREAEVKQAGDSVLMFEHWRENGESDLLRSIEDYNREDCDSTLRLRDWLLGAARVL